MIRTWFLLIAVLSTSPLSTFGQNSSRDLQDEIAAMENGLIGPVRVKGQETPYHTLADRMAFHKVPGVSIAIVKDGELRWARGYGIADSTTGSPVTTETLFQAGSISKPIAALGALKLMEEGQLDIDEDVNKYLIGWKVKDNKYTQAQKVTVRHLLTHTAGMTVHGFPGYKPTDNIPSIEEVLDGKGNTSEVKVDTIPGTIWRYSGGGYTVMEKVVEDISGMPLEDYLATNVLEPLGMTNSTYVQPLPKEQHAQASAAYDNQGELIEGLWHVYPEQAAAGLWTTPTDLAKYCLAVQQIARGRDGGPFRKSTIDAMLTKHLNDWGLGPSLTWADDSLRFQHGGKNAGFTNSMVAFAHRGDAYIIMTNADNGMALIRDIVRGVSAYYDWGIASPREVSLVQLSPAAMDRMTGKYLYVEQVPDIGDYFVHITREGNQLVVDDPNNGERDVMVAIGDLAFINLETGAEMVFEDKDGAIFRWNDQYEFRKANTD